MAGGQPLWRKGAGAISSRSAGFCDCHVPPRCCGARSRMWCAAVFVPAVVLLAMLASMLGVLQAGLKPPVHDATSAERYVRLRVDLASGRSVSDAGLAFPAHYQQAQATRHAALDVRVDALPRRAVCVPSGTQTQLLAPAMCEAFDDAGSMALYVKPHSNAAAFMRPYLTQEHGLAVEPDTVYEVIIECSVQAPAHAVPPVVGLEVVDVDMRQVLPRQLAFFGACDGKVKSLPFRTLVSSTRVEVRVVAAIDGMKQRDSASVNVKRLQLHRISPAAEYDEPALRPVREVHVTIATHAGRFASLPDAVMSVYPAAASIHIFCNNCSRQLPPQLQPARLSRLSVSFSEDWDDLGDAGKFFNVEALQSQPGALHATIDDDIVYPLDYLAHLETRLREFNDSAVVGVHCIVLSQPLTDYSSSLSRKTMGFDFAINRDLNVHLLGTGAVLYNPAVLRLKRTDLMYPNVADLVLGTAAQRQCVPRICVKRPYGWLQRAVIAEGGGIWLRTQQGTLAPGPHATNPEVREQLAGGANSIRETTNFLAKRSFPIARTRANKPKVVLAVLTRSKVELLQAMLKTWLQTRSLAYDWTLIIADDGSTDGTVKWLNSMPIDIDTETFILRAKGQSVVGRCNAVFELLGLVDFDFGFKVDDDVVFVRPGWDHRYISAMRATGVDHLNFFNAKLGQNTTAVFEPPKRHPSGLLRAFVDAWHADGALFTFTPRMLQRVGYADEQNFPAGREWHVDLTLRAARAGFLPMDAAYDITHSGTYVTFNRKSSRAALQLKDAADSVESQRRVAVMSDPNRVQVPLQRRRFDGAFFTVVPVPVPHSSSPQSSASRARRTSILNMAVDGAFVISPSREPARVAQFDRRVQAMNIAVEAFAAIDDADVWAAALYQAYLAAPAATGRVAAALVPKTFAEFLGSSLSQVSRAAFMEQHGQRALSRATFYHVLSWHAVLSQAMQAGMRAVAVFDDSALFHHDFEQRFADVLQRLPADWMICYLGAQQASFEHVEWAEGDPAEQLETISSRGQSTRAAKQTYYFGRGTSLSSHAIIVRDTAYLPVLAHLKLRMLPVDTGALSAVCTAFPRRCVTLFPNLVVHDVNLAHAIAAATPRFDQLPASEKAEALRWNMAEYVE